MIGIFIGAGLAIAGIALFLIGRRSGRRRASGIVSASHGSVAIGGNNNSPIINANSETVAASGGHWLTIFAIIVEIVGIAVMIWHASHLVGK